LSIVFIHYWGIVGDAFGTAIPLTLTSIFFLPPYLCRILNVSLADFLREAYLLPLCLCVPFAASLYFARRWILPHNYLQLALTLGVAGIVYGSSLLWVYFSRESNKVRLHAKLRQCMPHAPGE
jgi:hypothetical protein